MINEFAQTWKSRYGAHFKWTIYHEMRACSI